MNALKITPIPAFDDNYIWLLHNESHAVVIDPGDALPVIDFLQKHSLKLSAILITHHHADHIGGVPTLLKHFNIPVFGPRHEAIAAVTEPLVEGDTITIAQLALTLAVLEVPGHTRGHIAYVAKDAGWLFCGDTLFAGGCGRLFEGTPTQMAASLAKLAALPEATEVYCAHEYTLANLRFALEVEPDNRILIARMQSEQMKREQGHPTLPSTIALENKTNPFLRYREPAIVERLLSTGHLQQAQREPVAAFAGLREWKNSYR